MANVRNPETSKAVERCLETQDEKDEEQEKSEEEMIEEQKG